MVEGCRLRNLFAYILFAVPAHAVEAEGMIAHQETHAVHIASVVADGTLKLAGCILGRCTRRKRGEKLLEWVRGAGIFFAAHTSSPPSETPPSRKIDSSSDMPADACTKWLSASVPYRSPNISARCWTRDSCSVAQQSGAAGVGAEDGSGERAGGGLSAGAGAGAGVEGKTGAVRCQI